MRSLNIHIPEINDTGWWYRFSPKGVTLFTLNGFWIVLERFEVSLKLSFVVEAAWDKQLKMTWRELLLHHTWLVVCIIALVKWPLNNFSCLVQKSLPAKHPVTSLSFLTTLISWIKWICMSIRYWLREKLTTLMSQDGHYPPPNVALTKIWNNAKLRKHKITFALKHTLQQVT